MAFVKLVAPEAVSNHCIVAAHCINTACAKETVPINPCVSVPRVPNVVDQSISRVPGDDIFPEASIRTGTLFIVVPVPSVHTAILFVATDQEFVTLLLNVFQSV